MSEQPSSEAIANQARITGLIVESVICQTAPTLKGQILVSVDFFANDFYFRVRHTDGGKVSLAWGITAGHARFKEMIIEAAQACWNVRFGATSAIEIRKEADEIVRERIARKAKIEAEALKLAEEKLGIERALEQERRNVVEAMERQHKVEKLDRFTALCERIDDVFRINLNDTVAI